MRLRTIKKFISNNLVFTIALILALVSLLFMEPGTDVLAYIDAKTIACLFCILASVGVLAGAGAIDAISRLLTRTFASARMAILVLVSTTLVLSMFITNDMALVAMLPLAALILARGHWLRTLPFCFIMQNLAANLGGMILPFGNPQNLYLYSHYEIDFSEFLQVMFLPFAVSVVLIVLCCVIIVPLIEKRKKAQCAPVEQNAALKQKLTQDNKIAQVSHGENDATYDMPLRKGRVALGIALFVITVLAVFRVLSYLAVLAVVIVALLVFDRPTLIHMDWFLLLTFACFFVFAGVVSNIPVLKTVLGQGMNDLPLLVSAGISQIISNVPATVLLSQVTDVWQPLLVGVNIGGAGTLVASLASLITIGRYSQVRKAHAQQGITMPSSKRFTVQLMIYGFVFLGLLIVICSL